MSLPLRLCLRTLLVSLGLAVCIVPAARGRGAEPPVAANDKPAAAARRSLSAEEEYELFKLLADTVDQIERNYVKDISRRELMEAAIRGMLSKLDQYSNYIPPAEIEGFKGSVENEFGGIGIQISLDSGRLTVVSPLVGTPAYRAGIVSGDWIQEIDGQNTKSFTLDDAVKRMKGKVGTEVSLKVLRVADGKPETHKLKREVVRVETVLGDRRKDSDEWDYMYDHDKKIGYIRITSFGRHTSGELKKTVAELAERKLRGLILDLRFNPGGLLTSAIEVSDLFVSTGRIVSTSGRNVAERTVMAEKDGTYDGFPIAVLVNRYSASASEIVSACLQDHRLAIVVGERTWGKGSVQNIVELEEGKSALKLTTAAYHRPNGKNIHRFEGATDADDWGVRPDDGYEVKFTDAEMRLFLESRRLRDILKKEKHGADSGEVPFVDRQLQKALEYLTTKIADPAADPAAKPAGTPPGQPMQQVKNDAAAPTAPPAK